MSGRRLPPLPTVKDILRMYNINAKKKLSQNFIMDPRLLDKLAKAGGSLDGKVVVEVGPGPGGITRSILGQGARQCVVIEKDPRFIPALELLNEGSGGRLDIHIGDVMHFNMEKIFPASMATDWEGEPPNISLIGNLPFNVSTPLIIKWLNAMANKESLWGYGRVPLTLCFQLEVAQRMSAPPGHTSRSRLSVMCQNWARVHQNFTIPGGAFLPKPDVDVGVVTLKPLIVPYIDQPYKTVEKVVTTVFHGKKKKLYNTIGNLFPKTMSNNLCYRMLSETGINADLRAIDLDMAEWSRLCNSYVRIIRENPSLDKYNTRGRKSVLEPAVYDDGELFIDGESDDVIDILPSERMLRSD
eukprot:TRINITY_DN12570_c0_g1_i3.p1 TRINITY_DN12570_c0_g1~~TRINITY_DN12570_c0_g1_i3.p1  ORF type:complete len:356 (-),score=119.76 TRINITY_DN12570_c0_g1_i3:115-1182(-)